MKLHKLNWRKCPCGCGRQTPTNLGQFNNDGVGFQQEEVDLLNKAFAFMEQAENEGVTIPGNDYKMLFEQLMSEQPVVTEEVILAGAVDIGFRMGIKELAQGGEESAMSDVMVVGLMTGVQLVLTRIIGAAAQQNMKEAVKGMILQCLNAVSNDTQKL